MTLMSFLPEPCTVTTRGAAVVSDEGGIGRSDGTPQPAMAKVRQLRAEERTTGDDLSVTEWLVHVAPSDADPTSLAVAASSIVHVRDLDLEVIGEPELVGNDNLGRSWKFHATSAVR